MSSEKRYVFDEVNGAILKVSQVESAPEEARLRWRDAKKALRAWHMEQVKSLRKVGEHDYFA